MAVPDDEAKGPQSGRIPEVESFMIGVFFASVCGELPNSGKRGVLIHAESMFDARFRTSEVSTPASLGISPPVGPGSP